VRYNGVVPRGRVERVTTAAIAALGLAFGLLITITTIPQLELLDSTRNHPLVVGLHSAHADLNAAVGYERWEPQHLAHTATRLRALAVRYDNAGVVLEDAASHIDGAVARDDRTDAVVAHRIVDGLEHRVRDELRREQRRLHLPLT
jgi:hypothetical protein